MSWRKKETQKALDILYRELNDVPGLDKTPRYNVKVSDLIYVAQGDGDYKSDAYKEWYDADRVYFRSNVTGKKENFVLKYPNTGKPVLGPKERFSYCW